MYFIFRTIYTIIIIINIYGGKVSELYTFFFHIKTPQATFFYSSMIHCPALKCPLQYSKYFAGHLINTQENPLLSVLNTRTKAPSIRIQGYLVKRSYFYARILP